MLGFFEWFTIHNNWVFPIVAFVMWGILGMTSGNNWRSRLNWFLFVGLFGGLTLGGAATWDGYRTYKNHYTTCSRPEAQAAFYVFDFPRERCLKPFVGFVPVNSTGNVELKAVPEQEAKETKPVYQLVKAKEEKGHV